MPLSDEDARFVQQHPSAAMITVTAGGAAKVARIGAAVVEGKLWSSGTQSRVRTRRLRRDPRCTLFFFEPGFSWLAAETTVRILEGPDAPALNVHLFRVMQNRPTGPLGWFDPAASTQLELEEDQFLQRMVEEERLIYEFDVQRTYGLR